MHAAASVAGIPAQPAENGARLMLRHLSLQLIDHLLQLREELEEGSYTPGTYTHFFIHEPKRRGIGSDQLSRSRGASRFVQRHRTAL